MLAMLLEFQRVDVSDDIFEFDNGVLVFFLFRLKAREPLRIGDFNQVLVIGLKDLRFQAFR